MELSAEDKHANYMTLMRAIWNSTDRTDIDKWWKDDPTGACDRVSVRRSE